MSKPFLDFRFTTPFLLSTLPDHTNPVHRKGYPVGTTWDQVRAEWQSENWGFEPINYEWPACTDMGGYPLFYMTADGGVLSPASANENLEQTLGDDPQWQIVECDVNYEDEMYCDHSGLAIPSAYGEVE